MTSPAGQNEYKKYVTAIKIVISVIFLSLSVVGLMLLHTGMVDDFASLLGKTVDNPNTYVLARIIGVIFLGLGGLGLFVRLRWKRLSPKIRSFIKAVNSVGQAQWLVIVFVLALALRSGWVFLIANESYSDWKTYSERAADIVIHGRYGYPEPTAMNMPGYPLFLAAIYRIFGINELAGQLGNAFLNSLNCLLLYFIGKRVSESLGKISSLMLAIYPTHILISSYLCTDVLFTTTFLITVLYFSGFMEDDFTRTGRIAAGILLVGLSLYVRPVMLFFFIPFIYFLRRRGRLLYLVIGKYLLLYAGIIGLLLAPWWYRNYRVFHRFIPYTTQIDYAILTQAVHVEGMRVGAELSQDGLSELEQVRRMREMGIEYMLRNPGKLLKEKIVRAGGHFHIDHSYIGVYQFTPRNRFSGHRYRNIIRNFIEYIAAAGYCVMMVLFLIGLVFYWRERRRLVPLSFSLNMIVYVSLFMMSIYGMARYRFPTEPLMILFGSIPLLKVFRCSTRGGY